MAPGPADPPAGGQRRTDVAGIEKVTQLCASVERSLAAALEKAQGRAGGVVLVLDLDETCFTADRGDGLATSAWFEDLLQRWVPLLKSEAGMEPPEVLMESLAVVDCFYSCVAARLTEAALPELLKSCTARGIATIGLTARRPGLAPITWQQLGGEPPLVFDSLVPPMDDKAVAELEGYLRANGHAAPDNPDKWEGIGQSRGVWFTANANKGAILRQTLPAGSHVIFADDSERHLHNVRDALDGHAASVSLLHYTAAKDAAKERLDVAKCDLALAAFCADLHQRSDPALMELVGSKQTFLKTFIGRRLDEAAARQEQADEALKSLAAALQ